MKDNRAQVSVEYLLMATFAIILAVAAALAIDTLRGVADRAQAQALQFRENTIQQALR